ncbi:DNA methyltransferase [Endozoicomonas atrinae]|uniref:DNA methyltransferase n=1 Tax=Endozoicomonas atrinae TaxID=1333660 RepID=UPI003AFFF8F4
MNIAQIEENIKSLLADLLSGVCKSEDFIYELLLAYGHRKQSVSRLRSGERNIATKGNLARHDEIIWKRNLYFRHVEGSELHKEIDQMRNEKLVVTNKIRFVVVTNFDQLLAVDTKTSDTLDIDFGELPKKFDFFLPWAGMEKAVYQGENPADIKAAEKMAKLFDLIKADNFDDENKYDLNALHQLNVFLTRLLFCYFAEDTEIFARGQFSLAIKSHTKDDGSDLSEYLDRLFQVLNTSESDRGSLPEYLSCFPYVNGGLFADKIPAPKFTARSRRMLIECGNELDWSDINPDIFGSMIQAVVHPDQRGGMGMHYTSVSNIMKVIEPLFLNDFYEELEKFENNAIKLQKLQQRLGQIKIFDPACGSGNFLIIAYKELRKLEMEILKRLQELEYEKTGQISQPFTVIKLSQFYGIELDDFAHEVAMLSLWLAEHQMNAEFKVEFGEAIPSLPLKPSDGIVSGNSLRIDWEKLCGKEGLETFVLGNPPYIGAKNLEAHHKEDMKHVFPKLNGSGLLDYVSCWFYKASKFMRRKGAKIKVAFVSTSSITQGEQVAVLWPEVLKDGVEIFFAVRPFNWKNNAKENAGVHCVIIGLSNSQSKKTLFQGYYSKSVDSISPYLADGSYCIVKKRSKPLSDLPKMAIGNKPIDNGNYLFDEAAKNELLEREPQAKDYLYRWYGGREFSYGHIRWCLLPQRISGDKLINMPVVRELVSKVKEFRLSSSSKPTIKLAQTPANFHVENFPVKTFMVVQKVSTGRREYVPVGFFQPNMVASDLLNVIDSSDPFVFGLISSRMHMTWIGAIGGRFRDGFRYSNSLSYNTFPVPKDIPEPLRDDVIDKVMKVLAAREENSDMFLGDLYDPDQMPENLRCAHKLLDTAVDKCYSKSNFASDEARLDALFRLYNEMTGGQNA